MDVKLFSDLEGLRIAMIIEAGAVISINRLIDHSKRNTHKDLFRLLKTKN